MSVGTNLTMAVKQTLSKLHAQTPCVLRPTDHSAPPFMTVVEGQYQKALSSILPLGPINKAAATTAAVLRKPLYPFRLLRIYLYT